MQFKLERVTWRNVHSLFKLIYIKLKINPVDIYKYTDIFNVLVTRIYKYTDIFIVLVTRIYKYTDIFNVLVTRIYKYTDIFYLLVTRIRGCVFAFLEIVHVSIRFKSELRAMYIVHTSYIKIDKKIDVVSK